MKKVFLVILLIAVTLAFPALADRIEGAWTGIGHALGRTASVSANFDGNGGFTAYGMGVNVNGTYTLYDEGVTLSAENMTVSFSYASDGAIENLTGSLTYMGVTGTIILSRDVVSQETTPFKASDDIEEKTIDIYQAWLNRDRGACVLSFYKSGYAKISIEDEKTEQASLVSKINEISNPEASYSIADFINAVTNDDAGEYVYAARFETVGDSIVLTLLDDFKDSPDSFFTGTYNEIDSTLKFSYSQKLSTMIISDGNGKNLQLTASPLTKSEKDEKCFWRFIPAKTSDKGENVRYLQSKLIESGYLADKADGIFGKKTRAAVEKLQEQNGLEVTGVADEAVWGIIG